MKDLHLWPGHSPPKLLSWKPFRDASRGIIDPCRRGGWEMWYLLGTWSSVLQIEDLGPEGGRVGELMFTLLCASEALGRV